MARLLGVLASTLAIGLSASLPAHSECGCPSISGDLNITSYQLYPENVDFDERRCVAYFSVLYNATVAVYDPYKNQVIDTIEFPGLSFDPLLHSSGVQVDPWHRLSVIVDAGSAFDTAGANISGGNFLVKYGLASERILWQVNLTAVTDGVYGGFQDAEHDENGNTYALGTFPSSIIRVSADGQYAVPWYLSTPPDHTVRGFTGIVSTGKNLIVSDNHDGQLYKFDSSRNLGVPTKIPVSSGDQSLGTNFDGIYFPPQYSNKVLLVTDNLNGTVVIRSHDGKWESAEHLGTIPNRYASEGGFTTSTVQIAKSIYAVTEWFADEKVPGTLAGNRTSFPLDDITAHIEALLK